MTTLRWPRRHIQARPPRRHSGNSARSAHPGWSMGDRDEQVSWLAVLSPCIAFPDREDPVAFDAGRTAYSCGGSPGIEPEFPLNPREGNLSRTLTCRKTPARSTGVAVPGGLLPPVVADGPASRGCSGAPTRPSPASAADRNRAHGRGRVRPPDGCPAGMRSSSRKLSGSNSDTHPIPIPSARAASHRFWMAQATDARSISGMVRRPNTCLSRPGASAATRSSPHSRTPSTLSRMNSLSRSPSAARSSAAPPPPAHEFARASARSRTRMNRHGCISPTLGARCAAASSRSSNCGVERIAQEMPHIAPRAS